MLRPSPPGALLLVRFWALALPLSLTAALLVGIPTAIVRTPVFERTIPAGPIDYGIWAVTSVLLGLVAATYTLGAPAGCVATQKRAAGAGFLSFLAVGCPVCNKLVVLALGMSGTLTYFAPIQPLLGLASIALLAYTLHLRWRRSPRDPRGRVRTGRLNKDALAENRFDTLRRGTTQWIKSRSSSSRDRQSSRWVSPPRWARTPR